VPPSTVKEEDESLRKNTVYVEGLLDNLTSALDKWIMTGSPASKKRVYNVLEQIQQHAMDPELVLKAQRTIKRTGLPVNNSPKEPPSEEKKVLGTTDEARRRHEAEQRKRWEASRAGNAANKDSGGGRSALTRRAKSLEQKPDLFLAQVDPRLKPQSVANDKVELEKALDGGPSKSDVGLPDIDTKAAADAKAAIRVSEVVARAGAETAFDGQELGIGGLDDVLSEVKRRIWIPLAAPPQLLRELGIHPVRGLLLYGRPGCGKTLLARRLGQILSPLRPITVVSGPEVCTVVAYLAFFGFAVV
jgi:SpoVK/Ycf46/Vps4 family AAA+-type ATPase